MKPEAPKAKKKGNNKKVGKIVVAVGVCAAVVVVGVNIVPRLTQTDNPCVYLSGVMFREENRNSDRRGCI